MENAAIDPAIIQRTVPRRIFRMTVALDHVLDLREPDVAAALGLPSAPLWVLDKARCQATASRLRRTTAARALLVPSVALLDQLDRWVLVIFVDKLPTFPAPFVTEIHRLGTLPSPR